MFEAISGWLQHDEVVVPRAAVYPPGQSQQQTDTQNKADFQQSQDSATAAAFCELGYPKGFGVIDVEAKGPSAGRLRPGDQFVSVAGKPVTSRATLDAALGSAKPGTTVPIVVQRAGATKTVRRQARHTAEGHGPQGGGYLGVVPDNTCLAPFTVDLGLGNQIGGPSAGLMFALGIMDKVGKVDLTKGRFIAGTGTIDPAGTVGPIGGIALKMIAARAKGATVFLAPAGNCGDVRGDIPSGLHVVKVDTLHHAVQDLLRSSRAGPFPAAELSVEGRKQRGDEVRGEIRAGQQVVDAIVTSGAACVGSVASASSQYGLGTGRRRRRTAVAAAPHSCRPAAHRRRAGPRAAAGGRAATSPPAARPRPTAAGSRSPGSARSRRPRPATRCRASASSSGTSGSASCSIGV